MNKDAGLTWQKLNLGVRCVSMFQKRNVVFPENLTKLRKAQQLGVPANCGIRFAIRMRVPSTRFLFQQERHERYVRKNQMHSSQLAELGSWVAVNSGNLIYGEQDQPLLVATPYWTASKIRLQRWVTALKMFEQDLENPSKGHRPWPALEIVVQEILMSEILTRVWSATVLTHDWYHQCDEMHGLAHSVNVAHIEVKNRAIRILLRGQAANETAFDRMNGLRRRLERWTDLFLGQLPHGARSAVFGFDRNRVEDYNREQRESVGAQYLVRQKVLVASFAADITRDQVSYPANPDLNREIAAGVLACFPTDRFDSRGLPKSAQMIWLEKSQQDTQMLLDQLTDFEQHSSHDFTGHFFGDNG